MMLACLRGGSHNNSESKLQMGFNYFRLHNFLILASASFVSWMPCAAAELNFNGNKDVAIKIEPAKSTGLDAVYVLNGMKGVSISYTSASGSAVEWSMFDHRGGAFAETVDGVSHEGNKYTINNPQGNCGYIIKDGDRFYYFWIVDYVDSVLRIDAITPSENQECNATIIDIDGSGDAIYFYTINGRREMLSRELRLVYDTMAWNEEMHEYEQQQTEKIFTSFNDSLSITPPVYCNTIFTLYGDRFLEAWGTGISKESTPFDAHAVEVMTEALQEEDSAEGDEPSNEIKTDTEGLGGSAPAVISFKAYTTEAVIHNEWQLSSDPEFENIFNQIYEKEIEYTFTEEGTTYVRFIGSNSDGSCESYGDTYTVNIGASELKIPNAFSPGDDGVNDIWKVSYRSLLDFKCWIFDRHGHEIYRFDDPSGGWDGKKNGKYVRPGTYFYVIQATGSDGKKYKKSGDINILRHKGGNSVSQPDEQ